VKTVQDRLPFDAVMTTKFKKNISITVHLAVIVTDQL